MIRFIFGLIIGILLGALTVFAFTMLGGVPNSTLYGPLPGPGTAVVQVTVDARYLNQELNTLVTSQPGMADSQPQLALQAPNVMIFTAGVPIQLSGQTLTVRPTVTMQVQVQDGKITTHVTNISLGPISVPTALVKPQIDQMEGLLQNGVNRAVSSTLAGSGLTLYSVSTSPSAMTVDLGE